LLSDRELLRHIRDEMEFLIADSREMTLSLFLSDETRKRAYARSLEIIGEAAKALSPELTLNHPDVEWRNMAAMRNRLIHGYFSVDYSIVWDAAVTKIPGLINLIRLILDSPGV